MCVGGRGRYGVVLRKLDLLKEAVEVFVEAIHALPLHWGAWLELSNLVTNSEMVTTSCLTPESSTHPLLSLLETSRTSVSVRRRQSEESQLGCLAEQTEVPVDLPVVTRWRWMAPPFFFHSLIPSECLNLYSVVSSVITKKHCFF